MHLGALAVIISSAYHRVRQAHSRKGEQRNEASRCFRMLKAGPWHDVCTAMFRCNIGARVKWQTGPIPKSRVSRPRVWAQVVVCDLHYCRSSNLPLTASVNCCAEHLKCEYKHEAGVGFGEWASCWLTKADPSDVLLDTRGWRSDSLHWSSAKLSTDAITPTPTRHHSPVHPMHPLCQIATVLSARLVKCDGSSFGNRGSDGVLTQSSFLPWKSIAHISKLGKLLLEGMDLCIENDRKMSKDSIKWINLQAPPCISSIKSIFERWVRLTSATVPVLSQSCVPRIPKLACFD